MKKILLGALLGMMVLVLVAAAPDDTTIFGAGGNSEFLWWYQGSNGDMKALDCVRAESNEANGAICTSATTHMVAPAPGTVTKIAAQLLEVANTDTGCVFTWSKNGTTDFGNVSVVEIPVDATDLSAVDDTFFANVSTHLDAGDYLQITYSTEADSSKCTGTCACTGESENHTVSTWFIFD